jgi:hypothetical protein
VPPPSACSQPRWRLQRGRLRVPSRRRPERFERRDHIAVGSDILSGGTYTGIDFKDYSFYLGGSAIQDFAPSDILDFNDVNASAATVTYTGGTLSITDDTHAAVLGLSFAGLLPAGSFHVASDGAGGTKLTWS